MPQADGTILIDTEINADGMKAGSKEVEAAVRRMASSVTDLGTKARTALNKQVDSFAKLNQEYAAQAKKVDELKRKVAEYGNQKVPTEEYREIQAQIDQATTKMNRLIAQQERFEAMGGSQKSNTYKKYQYDIDELANTIKYAEGELRDLEETGKAFTFGSQTKEAAADMERLASAERKLADMNNRLGTSYSSIKGQVNDYNNALTNTNAQQQKASASGNKLSKSLSSTGKSAKSASFGIGRMLGTSILFSFVFQAISGVMNAMKEGFTNLAQYSGTTNNSISMLWSSLERLKNSLATAFAPILNVVAPILSKFIDMLSTAASYVSMFFAFLSGQSTYTRAIAVQKDYAASLADTASGAQDAADATNAAADAAERYLSPLDDINRFTDQNNGGGGGGGAPGGSGGGGGTGSGPLFEEVPIDNKFASLLDSVLDKLKQIRDIFVDGFWDGLGDYKPILKDLKKDLKSIGKSIVDIFTDADVQGAADNFAKSFIYALGQVVGSFASIGLTIANNIVGGIEKYLKQNKNRIKKYLVDMFDVGAELASLVGNFSAAFADVIAKVFGSETAQQITGNIIGIFSEVGMLVSNLALKLMRDLANIIVTPFIENKERITQALLGTLEAIEPITSGILTAVQTISDSIVRLYDEHIAPFFASIASGLSTIIEALLEGYNTYILPILEGLGLKFQELMEGPFAQMVTSVEGFLARVIDALKLLWEQILVPILTWLSEKFFPVIAPAIELLGNVAISTIDLIIKAIGYIADTLSGIIDFIVGVFTGDWELAWKGIREIFQGAWNIIKTVITTVWEAIKEIIKGGVEFVKNAISTAWEGVKTLTGTVWNGIKTSIGNIWEGIKTTAISIFDNIRTKVNGAWESIEDVAHDVWEGLSSWIPQKIQDIRDAIVNKFKDARNTVERIFAGIVNSIKSVINGAIGIANNAVNMINSAIGGIENAFTFGPWEIPTPFGTRTIGFQATFPRVPTIPYLASGAVIPPNKEFMAVLGDQRHGTNIEAPLSTIEQAVRNVIGNGGVQRIEVPIYLNRREIARATVEEGKLIRMQTGKNPFELA